MDLKTSQLFTPLGVEDGAPAFSWRMQSERRGAAQTAYRIIVSSDQRCAHGEADIWDSGRIVSSQSSGVIYGGPPLRSRQRCYWTVEMWDDRNEMVRAAPTWWEMGLLDDTDWTAQWISAESELERDDRVLGMGFVAAAPQAGPQRFRLDFIMTDAGLCEITLGCGNALRSLAVDGEAQAIPPRSEIGWGPRPSGRWAVQLGAGAHALTVEAEAPKGQPSEAIILRSHLRLMLADGRVQRLNTGWRTSRDEAANWRLVESAARDWPPAAESAKTIEDWPPAPARYLRKSFSISKPVASARLYVSALGAYEAYLNGQRISEDRLGSESTDFRKRVLYRVHDVTQLLRRGDNALGAHVGDGWYASYQAPTGRYAYGAAPRRFIAQLEIVFQDGSRETIVTDPSWRAYASPVISSEIYDGEHYDARLEIPSWSELGCDDVTWDATWIAPRPQAHLSCLVSAPIRATREIRPRAVTEPHPGVFVFDLGQNFAGWARLRVQASAGTAITLRFAEVLLADGGVDQSNLRAARAADIYVAKGEGVEVYEPCFTYHGFRYVQVEGISGWPSDDCITGIVVHTDLLETGLLETGSETISQLWRNTLWSQRSNFVGLPTDCPQRDERLGWTGDACVFWDAAAYNMDVAAFTRRYLNDLRDGQRDEDGAFGIFAPSTAFVIGADRGATPVWSDASVTLPWVTAWRYGDVAVINDNWRAMQRYLAGILANNPDYIWRRERGSDFGDWLSLDGRTPDEATTPKDLIGTAMLVQNFERMADMARWTGRERDVAEYRAHADAARAAFIREYLHADGVIGNGSHTSYILAILLQLAPEAVQARVQRNFVADIRRRGKLLTTGFVGTPLSLDALATCGDTALLYDLLLRTEFPSWGYMVARGATTIWERWNSDTGDVAMNSFNHYALGSVCGFMFRRIAGIDAAAPGFSRLRMRPLMDARVGRASARYDSVRGPIAAGWRLDGERLTYDVMLPPNVSAEVILPAPPGARICEHGRLLEPGHSTLRMHSGGFAAFELGAGHYVLTVD